MFFKKELAEEFDYRAKQAGQLVSKTRFLAAPWVGLLSDGVWLRNAEHANESAAYLAERLQEVGELQPEFPREANAIFLRMAEPLVSQLHERGWRFNKSIEPDIYRLMCSWAVKRTTLDEFIADVKALRQV